MKKLLLTEFREDLERMKNRASTFEELKADLQRYLYLIRREDLPPFPNGHMVTRKDLPGHKHLYIYQGKQYGDAKNYPMEKRSEIYIAPEACVGTTWLYDKNHREGQPYADRLIRCLLGSPETAPLILITQVGDYYMCNDGNHRIYAAYLMGRKVHVLVMGRNEETHDNL